MSIDAHCHLTDPRFTADLTDVAGRLSKARILAAVTAGTQLESSRAAAHLALRFPEIYAAVGVHPGEAHLAPADHLETLATLAQKPKVVAIGEIGLDRHHGSTHYAAQERVFTGQLQLALALQLPVVIHSRKAEREAFELVRASGIRRALFHCFTGGQELAGQIIDKGFLIGVTGIATFGDPVYEAMIASLPLEGILAETDAPYLAPAPFRGKRNEPAYVERVVEKIASLRPALAPEDAALTLEKTARSFFNI